MTSHVAIKPRKIRPEWRIDVKKAHEETEDARKEIQEFEKQMRINKQVPREIMQQQITK